MNSKLFFLPVLFFFYTISLFAQDLQMIQIASGLDNPVDIANAGDERLFIVEQDGRIRVIDEQGNLLDDPFLDITNDINITFNEQGLLGLAFHPDYQTNGYFFVNYTNNSGDTRVVRFSVSCDPNVADEDSGETILSINQPYANHNGGELAFGPDGYLYIGTGDGGSGGDPLDSGQDNTSLLGKMLRLDVNNGAPWIPADNPFVDDNSVEDEIWATGLRNPWRYSFDRETGDLWIADVGQNAREEISLQPANSTGGENYGWRCREGFSAYNTSGCGDASEYVEPIWDYGHSGGACSVTGGYIYRGIQLPSLYGHYVYADFCNGKIWSLTPDGNGGWNNVELLDESNNQISSFGQDMHGEIYMAKRSQGRIYKVDTEQCSSFDISATWNATDGNIDLTVDGGSGNFDILWSNNETAEDLSGLTPGIYAVTVSDIDTDCKRVYSVNLTNDAAVAVPTFIVDGNVLTATDGYASYQWYFNGLPIDNATEQTYEIGFSGNYSVEGFNEQGCSAISEEQNLTLVDLKETINITEVKLTPNPFNDTLKLLIKLDGNAEVSIEIIDVKGSIVYQEQDLQVNAQLRKNLNLEELSSGLYFLKVRSDQGEITKRIVKD